MPNNLGLDPFPDPVGHFGAPWRPFCISRPLIGRVLGSKTLFSESDSNLGLDPFQDPVGHFGAPWRPFCISRPLIGRNTECSDQKTYLAKVVRSAHITIEKWSPFLDLGGPKLVCLGGRQTKSSSNQKTYFAKAVRSAHITLQKWSRFFDLGGPRLANEKLLGWKNLFSESCLERPSYYKEVTSVFWFEKSKLAFSMKECYYGNKAQAQPA